MYLTKHRRTPVVIIAATVIAICQLLAGARAAHATQAAAIDEKAWGFYTKLVGTYKAADRGYIRHWKWEVPGVQLKEQWLDPKTKRVYLFYYITLGSEPGKFKLSGLAAAVWHGTRQPDGSVVYVRDAWNQSPFRASLEPDGSFEVRNVKMSGDQIVHIKQVSKYERFLPMEGTADASSMTAQASAPAPVSAPTQTTPAEVTETATPAAAPVAEQPAVASAASFGLSIEATPDGLKVLDVAADSPATAAGMTAGMIITHLNDLPIKGIAAVTIASMIEPLDAMKLTVADRGSIELSCKQATQTADPPLRSVPDTWGVLYQMAGSKWLIATEAGQMLATEPFVLEWSEAQPAYTSVLRLKGETSGAQLFSFELDPSHRFVVTSSRTGESPAYLSDSAGELAPASTTEMHRMRRVSPTQVATEKKDSATGLWKVVYNYFQVAAPVATVASVTPATAEPAPPPATPTYSSYDSSYPIARADPEIPRDGSYRSYGDTYSSHNGSSYPIARADPEIPRDGYYDNRGSSSSGNLVSVFQNAFGDAMNASNARDAQAAAMIQEAVRQGEAIREMEEQRRRLEMQAAQERERELAARQQAQFEAQRQREEAARQVEQLRREQQRLGSMRASNPSPGSAGSRSSSSPSNCRLVDGHAKTAIGDGPSENEALAAAMAKINGCAARTDFCDKRREILKVNAGGTYTTTEWFWECRVSYQCGEQRQVCDPPAGPVGASKQ